MKKILIAILCCFLAYESIAFSDPIPGFNIKNNSGKNLGIRHVSNIGCLANPDQKELPLGATETIHLTFTEPPIKCDISYLIVNAEDLKKEKDFPYAFLHYTYVNAKISDAQIGQSEGLNLKATYDIQTNTVSVQ